MSFETPGTNEKEIHWQEMESRVNGIEDKLGEKIDPGMKEAVIALNLLNINTTQSCEGHEDRGTGGPYIDIEARESAGPYHRYEKLKEYDTEEAEQLRATIIKNNLAEQKKLFPLLTEFYKNRSVPEEIRLGIHQYGLAISRLKNNGVSLQEIAGTDEYKENIRKFQDEMGAFKEFLKQKYFSQ